jgi:hypothetical protein
MPVRGHRMCLLKCILFTEKLESSPFREADMSLDHTTHTHIHTQQREREREADMTLDHTHAGRDVTQACQRTK